MEISFITKHNFFEQLTIYYLLFYYTIDELFLLDVLFCT